MIVEYMKLLVLLQLECYNFLTFKYIYIFYKLYIYLYLIYHKY